MLCSIDELDGYTIAARDGEIGHVRHAYFDDERWVIRHLVVQTGSWLAGRDVLVSPHAVERVDTDGRRLVVALTRKQVEEAPGIDTDQPVSRQQEARYYDHFGYPYYWAGTGLWGPAAYPMAYVPPAGAAVQAPDAPVSSSRAGGRERDSGDPHLRSSSEVTGYHIAARDGSIGHVEDFLFDPQSWAVRHIVVDTRNWLPGRKVLVEPGAIEQVDWAEREVRVSLTREAVKSSPEYHPDEVLGHQAA